MRTHKLTRLIILGTLIISLTACSSYQKKFETSESDYGTRNISDDDTQIKSRPQATSNPSYGDHQNSAIEFSQPASHAISALGGIRDAFVVVTDKNAYVALLLDQTATGMKGKGEQLPSDNTIGSNQFHFTPENSKTLEPGTIWTDKYSFDTIPDNDDLSSELRAHVTAKIGESFPAIKTVYISANPGFINAMSQYAHEAWRGNSINPYLEGFNTVVQKVFPVQHLITE